MGADLRREHTDETRKSYQNYGKPVSSGSSRLGFCLFPIGVIRVHQW